MACRPPCFSCSREGPRQILLSFSNCSTLGHRKSRPSPRASGRARLLAIYYKTQSNMIVFCNNKTQSCFQGLRYSVAEQRCGPAPAEKCQRPMCPQQPEVLRAQGACSAMATAGFASSFPQECGPTRGRLSQGLVCMGSQLRAIISHQPRTPYPLSADCL